MSLVLSGQETEWPRVILIFQKRSTTNHTHTSSIECPSRRARLRFSLEREIMEGAHTSRISNGRDGIFGFIDLIASSQVSHGLVCAVEPLVLPNMDCTHLCVHMPASYCSLRQSDISKAAAASLSFMNPWIPTPKSLNETLSLHHSRLNETWLYFDPKQLNTSTYAEIHGLLFLQCSQDSPDTIFGCISFKKNR